MVAHYYDVFAEVYDERWGQQDYAGAELAFLRELAGDGSALEVGIGTRRVAIPLAEAGVTVVGVDPSPKMLAVLARKLAGAPHLKVEAGVGDMTLAGVTGRFGLVFCVYHTLFYADSREEQQQFFHRAAQLLAPGGAVVVEGYQPGQTRRARWAKGVRVCELSPDGFEYELYRHDEANQTLEVGCYSLAGAQLQYSYWVERYLTAGQTDELAAEAGLALSERWGSYARAPFDDASSRCVSVYVSSSS